MYMCMYVCMYVWCVCVCISGSYHLLPVCRTNPSKNTGISYLNDYSLCCVQSVSKYMCVCVCVCVCVCDVVMFPFAYVTNIHCCVVVFTHTYALIN